MNQRRADLVIMVAVIILISFGMITISKTLGWPMFIPTIIDLVAGGLLGFLLARHHNRWR